ncbi:MAG: EF-hand domain-containing protein [Porticoccus sp.]
MKKLILTVAVLGLTTAVWAGHDNKGAHEGHHEGKHHSTRMMFEKMDTNEDGVISAEEHEASIQQMVEKRSEHFAKMDTDNDGSVTKEEAKAARESMREKMGEQGKRRECMDNKEE